MRAFPCCIPCAAFLLAVPSRAELITFATVAGSQCSESRTGTDTASIAVGGCFVFDERTGAGAATATASYNVLSASVFARHTATEAFASSSFADILTIFGFTGTGSIQYTFHVTVNANPAISRGEPPEVTANAPGVAYHSLALTPNWEWPSVNTDVTQLLVFTFGQPFAFGAALDTTARVGQADQGLDAQANLVSIRIFSGDQPVSGLGYASESGALYPFEGATPVPEPDLWALVGGAGLMFIGLTQSSFATHHAKHFHD